jgi:hypothetical protein
MASVPAAEARQPRERVDPDLPIVAARGARVGVLTLALEAAAQKQANLGLIVHDEDVGGIGAHRSQPLHFTEYYKAVQNR